MEDLPCLPFVFPSLLPTQSAVSIETWSVNQSVLNLICILSEYKTLEMTSVNRPLPDYPQHDIISMISSGLFSPTLDSSLQRYRRHDTPFLTGWAALLIMTFCVKLVESPINFYYTSILYQKMLILKTLYAFHSSCLSLIIGERDVTKNIWLTI